MPDTLLEHRNIPTEECQPSDENPSDACLLRLADNYILRPILNESASSV